MVIKRLERLKNKGFGWLTCKVVVHCTTGVFLGLYRSIEIQWNFTLAKNLETLENTHFFEDMILPKRYKNIMFLYILRLQPAPSCQNPQTYPSSTQPFIQDPSHSTSSPPSPPHKTQRISPYFRLASGLNTRFFRQECHIIAGTYLPI